ncbi:MAG TPA: YSC84-related protein [Pseudomonadales bacterium]|nr:YSC84-related protein [Pseudomonadales bacterium]
MNTRQNPARSPRATTTLSARSRPVALLCRALALTLLVAGLQAPARAASAVEIDARADVALERLTQEVPEASRLLTKAAGVLVFPRVIKAGIGIGGEYGEGVLRIDGRSAGYYSTAAASIGFQLGAQAKAQFLLFMSDAALADFRGSDGWEVGVDGSVTLVKVGAGGSIDSSNLKDPVVGFVLADRGLMYDLSLAGSKISSIQRD